MEFYNLGDRGGPLPTPESGNEKVEDLGKAMISALEGLLTGDLKGAMKKTQQEIIGVLTKDKNRSGAILMATMKTMAEHILTIASEKCEKCLLKEGSCHVLHDLSNIQDIAGFLYVKIDESKTAAAKDALKKGKLDLSNVDVTSLENGDTMIGPFNLEDILGGKKNDEEDKDED